MSNQPENLISGYLDNQLTASERAEAEKLLRENPDMNELLEKLRQQSQDVSELPKFNLGAGFVDRLLNDNRVKDTLSDLVGPKTSLGIEKVSYPASSRLGTAAAAIASLAALVLITLFFQNADNQSGELAMVESAVSNQVPHAADSVQNPKSDWTKGSNEVMTKGAAASSADSPRESAGIVLGETVSKDGLRSRQILAVDPEGKLGQTGSSVFQMESKAIAKSDLLRSQIRKSDSRIGRLEEAKAVQKKPVMSKGQGRSRFSAGVEKNKSLPSRTGQSANVAEAENPVLGLAGIERDDAVPALVGQAVANSVRRSVDDVLQIDYTGGPTMMVEFRKALLRQKIDIGDLTEESWKDATSASAELFADDENGGGTSPSKTRGNYEPVPKLVDKLAAYKDLEFGQNSHVFLVTATPKQMDGLIADVKSNAAVTGFQLPELSSVNQNPAHFRSFSERQLTREKLKAGDMDDEFRFAEEHVRELKTLEPGVAGGEQAAVQIIGGKRINGLEADSARRETTAPIQTNRGFAQQLQRKIDFLGKQKGNVELRKSFVDQQQPKPGLAQGKSGNGVGFEVSPETESQKPLTRQYLLFVRTQEKTTGDSAIGRKVESRTSPTQVVPKK